MFEDIATLGCQRANWVPHSVPQFPGVTVAGRTQPARLIGGDLYDFFDLGAGRAGFLCADVSGKGIPAALMMANLQAIARGHSGRRQDSPSLRPDEFVEILNQELNGCFGDNRYATHFWCEYDIATRKLQYINAGNPSPFSFVQPVQWRDWRRTVSPSECSQARSTRRKSCVCRRAPRCSFLAMA
jgi:serine phosphatase RsbU (regulator of sigma subunit)